MWQRSFSNRSTRSREWWGLKIHHHNLVCRFDSDPRHHITNQALMPGKQYGIGAFSSCVRPLKELPHICGVKSILQIKPSLFKNMIGIQRARRWLHLSSCQGGCPFWEGGDHMSKGRAGGYNTCEIKNRTILRLGPGGDKSGVSGKGRPS